jgi:hypothetical protein
MVHYKNEYGRCYEHKISNTKARPIQIDYVFCLEESQIGPLFVITNSVRRSVKLRWSLAFIFDR